MNTCIKPPKTASRRPGHAEVSSRREACARKRTRPTQATLATERLLVALRFMGAATGRAERERERLRKLEAKRKQQRWLNPSAAQLQCEHEYMDWVLARPEQWGDEPRNDTWKIFMVERRIKKEKERLRLVALRRRQARQEEQEKQGRPRQFSVSDACAVSRDDGRVRSFTRTTTRS